LRENITGHKVEKTPKHSTQMGNLKEIIELHAADEAKEKEK